jgi:hypothetical protein
MKDTAPVLPTHSRESERSSLSKPTKQQRIALDVRRQIREGQVKPGDRLRPFTELTRLYATSPGVVTEALEGLEKEGIILRKPRSGCYVTADAAARLAAALEPGHVAPAVTPAPSVDDAMLAYRPVPARLSTPLAMVTTDYMPAQVAAWESLLASFAGHSGGPVPVVRSLISPFTFAGPGAPPHDLLIGTPTQLCAAGVDNYLPVTEPVRSGLPVEAMIAPLRNYLADVPTLSGVPIAMAFPLLFLNVELADSAGYTGFGTEGAPSALMQALVDVLPSPAAERPSFSAEFGSLPRLMVHEGALRVEANSLTIDEGKTRALLHSWNGLRSKLGPGPTATWADYAGGRVVVKSGFGFCGFEARTALRFRWESRFPPIAPEARGEALPLLAAVRRDTPRLPECLDLVHYLCTPEAQRQIGARGDIVPMRTDAIAPNALPLAPPMTREAVDRWLDRLTAPSSLRPADNMLVSDLERIGERFQASSMTADQAIGQLGVLIDRYSRLGEPSHRQ